MIRINAKRENRELRGSQELSEDAMFSVVGGISEFDDLSRKRAKCPVEGCNFECGRLGELNIHLRTCHPEYC